MGHFTEHGVRCWNSGVLARCPPLSSGPGKVSEERIKAHILALLCEPIVTADGVPMVRAIPSSEETESVRVPNVSR